MPHHAKQVCKVSNQYVKRSLKKVVERLKSAILKLKMAANGSDEQTVRTGSMAHHAIQVCKVSNQYDHQVSYL